MSLLFDHDLTKADVTALLATLGHEMLVCGCGEACPRCECLVAIAAAALWRRFTREELQAVHAGLVEEATP